MHRTQILFPHWLNEYIDFASSQCNISKGEMIRAMTSLGILVGMKARGEEPENYNKLMSTFENIQKNCGKLDLEQISMFHDDLHYETRKAVENRLEKIKNKK